MELRERFEQHRRESDPSISVSDAQAEWMLAFMERESAREK